MIVEDDDRALLRRTQIDGDLHPPVETFLGLRDRRRNPEPVAAAQDADADSPVRDRAGQIEAVHAPASCPQWSVANAIRELPAIADHLESLSDAAQRQGRTWEGIR